MLFFKMCFNKQPKKTVLLEKGSVNTGGIYNGLCLNYIVLI